MGASLGFYIKRMLAVAVAVEQFPAVICLGEMQDRFPREQVRLRETQTSWVFRPLKKLCNISAVSRVLSVDRKKVW